MRTGCDIRSFPLAGGSADVIASAQVKSDQETDCHASMGPDARGVVFVRRGDGRYHIEHLDIATKARRLIADIETSWFPYVLWQDTQHIAVQYSTTDDYLSEHYDVTTGKRTTPPLASPTQPLAVSLTVEDGRLTVRRPADGASVRIALHVDEAPRREDSTALRELLR